MLFMRVVQKGVPDMKKPQTTKQVIAKFKKTHGDRYAYSKVNFQGSHTKVTIICSQHGEYEQTPAIHIRGSKCPTCGQIEKGQKKRIDGETVIKRFKEIHGDQYDYTPTIYTTNRSKITVNCRIHGAFNILPDNHMKGKGCGVCGLAKKYQRDSSDILDEFRTTHGDRYDYSKFVYTGSNKAGEIICPDHGSFQQSYYTHKNGHGCPACGFEKTADARTQSHDAVIQRFTNTHGDRYDYDKMIYSDSDNPVIIGCTEHGDFNQSPRAHYSGQGCPTCAHSISVSAPETAIGDYIEELGFEVVRNTRKLISPKEIDIYLPEQRLAIEYCGLYWHGESRGKVSSYHQSKMLLLQQLGITLLTIFEDEWLDKPDVVKSILKTRLGLSDRRDGGRKLYIKDIASHESREFLNRTHIQGAATGSVHIGAFNGADELVGVMVFGAPTRQTSSYEWELKRYSTDGTSRAGMMAKLFQHFIRSQTPESVVSFSDMRWFSGASYQKIGFFQDGIISPDYAYVKNGIRHNKSKFRKDGIRRHLPEHYESELTEREMMESAGYDRIWDCGKIRWVWANY
jgi:hypothetical protein